MPAIGFHTCCFLAPAIASSVQTARSRSLFHPSQNRQLSSTTPSLTPGYLEEEAVHTYSEMLKDIDSGAIANVAAPKIAIEYWGLPLDATLRDVVLVVRADEADHRLLNHHLSNRFDETKAARAADASVSPYEQLGDVDLESIVGPTVSVAGKAKGVAPSK